MKAKILGLVVGILTAATVGLGQLNAEAALPGQVGDAPRCTVTAVGDRASAFNLGANPAPVTFKVTGGKNCKVRMSTGSFYAPSMDGKPYNKQILFHRNIRVFDTPGTYTMVAPIPTSSTPTQGCYYQVDLSYGTVVNTPVIAYGHGKIPGCGDQPQQPEAKDIQVCRLSDKVYPVTIKEDQFNPALHSKNPEDCKQTPPPAKPAITITKTVDGVKQKEVGVNTQFTYQITVKNTGDTELVDAVVSDKADAGVTFISASAGTVNANTWTYTIPKLAVGQSISYTITAKVPTHQAGAIKNTVCVDTPTIPGGPDGCDTATVTVPEPGKVPVCDETTKTIITVPETDKDKYAPVDSEKCKAAPVPTTPVTPATTTTVTELPQTGPVDAILKMLGAASLTGSATYYLASRRQG